jgi:hypothetical protein
MQETTAKAASDASSSATSWANGWYLYEDGQVIGPLNADDTFSRGETTKAGQKRLVSRKGFTQWYPIDDFVEMHMLAKRYQISDAKGQDSAGGARAGITEQSPVKHLEPRAKVLGPAGSARAAQPGMSMQTVESLQSHERMDVAADVTPVIKNPIKKDLSRKEKKKLASLEKRDAKRQQLEADHAAAQAAAAGPAVLSSREQFQDQYLRVAGRLRLGKIKSAFWSSFLLTPVTLFGYWAVWLLTAGEEVTWHLTGSGRVRYGLPILLAMIPGFHLLFAWWLVRLIAEMEKQNGYQTVHLWFDPLLALFPPIFMHKMQVALNRHWTLHVHHAK